MTGRLWIPTLALSLAACSGTAQSRVDALAVNAAPVRLTPFEPRQELSGDVVAARSVTVGSAVAGPVVAVDVRVGDPVRAGDPIAEVDASQYRAQYDQARGNAAAAQADGAAARAQLDAARSRLRLASLTASRMNFLYVQGAISVQDNDRTRADLAAARAAADQAAAGVQASQNSAAAAGAGVEAAGVPLQETQIRAPFDGVITARFVEPGAVVGPGGQIATLQNQSELELDVTAPLSTVGGIEIGAPIDVRVDELGDARIRGTARALVPNENPALRSAVLKISIPAAHGLMPGMYARIVVPGTRTIIPAVPVSALVTRAGQTGVFAIRAGRADFVPVQPGQVQNGSIAITGSVRPGDAVVTSDLERVTQGAAVATPSP
jgi:RND family efflux transporter MFP subunit